MSPRQCINLKQALNNNAMGSIELLASAIIKTSNTFGNITAFFEVPGCVLLSTFSIQTRKSTKCLYTQVYNVHLEVFN